jgi:transcription initiation factor IIE alpha subunit
MSAAHSQDFIDERCRKRLSCTQRTSSVLLSLLKENKQINKKKKKKKKTGPGSQQSSRKLAVEGIL